MPRNLRELVNLVSLLGDMGENKRENLDELERYFCDVWMEENLADSEADEVRRLVRKQNRFLHQDAVSFLYNLTDIGSVNLSKGKTLGTAVRDAYNRMNREEFQLSNGDVMNCIRLLQKRKGGEAVRLGAALSIVFSIRMLKLKEAGAMEELYDFVGDDLFGFYRLIREEAESGNSRIKFSYSVQEFIERYCDFKVDYFSVSSVKEAALQTGKREDLLNALVLIGSTSEFISADGTKRVMVSENNQVATQAMFDVNTVFRSAISKERILEKLSINKWGYSEAETKRCIDTRIYLTENWMTLVCNMEMMMNLGQYEEQNRDIKNGASETEYYMHFFQSVDKFMNQYSWSWDDSEGTEEDKKEWMILGIEDLVGLTEVVIQMKGDGNRGTEKEMMLGTGDAELKKMKIPPVSNSRWKTMTFRKNVTLLNRYIERKFPEADYGKKLDLVSKLSGLVSEVDKLEDSGQRIIGREIADAYNWIRKQILA